MTNSLLSQLVHEVYSMAQYAAVMAEHFGALCDYLIPLNKQGLVTGEELARLEGVEGAIVLILSKRPELKNDQEFLEAVQEERQRQNYRARWGKLLEAIARFKDPEQDRRYRRIRQFILKTEFATNVASWFATSFQDDLPTSIYGIEVVVDDSIEGDWKVVLD